MFRIAAIVVNYRTPELTIGCLASLQGELIPGLDKIVVVDNASGDDSFSKLETWASEQRWIHQDGFLELIQSDENLGFSGGNNLGISSTSADHYLLLNSDTIVRAGAIAELLKRLANSPRVGLLGPRLEGLECDPQISRFRFPTPLGELVKEAKLSMLEHFLTDSAVPIQLEDSKTSSQWVSFACVLIRREVIDDIGKLDDGYFMYFEDVDYCRRARKSGWLVEQEPAARVVHLRGGTSTVKRNAMAGKSLPMYFYQSRSYYFRKFHGLLGLVLANCMHTLGWLLARLKPIFGGSRHTTPKNSVRDMWATTLANTDGQP